jgi:hypothetical protein
MESAYRDELLLKIIEIFIEFRQSIASRVNAEDAWLQYTRNRKTLHIENTISLVSVILFA